MIHRLMGGTRGLDSVREEIRQWRKTGVAPDGFSSAATDWGNQYEPQAFANAKIATGLDFQKVGLIVHPELGYIGASPDGIDDGSGIGLEIKCPHNPENHIRMFLREKIPRAYIWQMQCGMWVTGFERWLFVSHDPRLLEAGEENHTVLHWIDRSEQMIRQMDQRTRAFWETI